MSVPANVLAQDIEALEDRMDGLIARLARIELANEEAIPGDVVWRLCGGESPVRVWREYRGLAPDVLAQAAGMALDDLAAIEQHRAEPSLRAAHGLARALHIDIDDIADWQIRTDLTPIGTPAQGD